MVSLLITVIVVALIFDYINGFHDSANAIATTVSTGVMSLAAAVLLAGVFNFVGAIYGTEVAKFIAQGLADAKYIDQVVVLAALLGASAWNLITWWYGIPSSSSHALIGGIAGAVAANAGWGAVKWNEIGNRVLLPLVISPVIGFTIALLVMIAAFWIVRRMRPGTVNRGSRALQLVSACTFSFSHGSNDAQKTMGIMTMALIAFMTMHSDHLPQWMADHPSFLPHSHTNDKGKLVHDVPYWVMLSCATAMALGTMIGGKRIIKTMGAKIYRINPLQGFAAQTSGTAVILSASHLGIPISTTHCISAAIMGAGVSKRISAVRWGVAINILIAWILTLPLSALVAYGCLIALRAVFGNVG
ncbi:MAG: inorganic phosphate transporter [Planctomycetes bacterium]|nr:inorganic phosphate transporter [Planctomycetota bacterium]